MILLMLFLSVIATCVFGSDIKPIDEVVKEFGYLIETHTVPTSDGYKLTVHRLLGRNRHRPPHTSGHTATLAAVSGVPVLVVEGILQSSASNLAKGDGIAYSLADRGFDVWLSNYRGNMYSREHETLSPSSKTFWNFTLHDMGTEDLPAVIDYVLDATHRQQLIYIGFSMGTTMFWVMASSMPTYQDKVAAMIAIGPVARPSNTLVLNNGMVLPILEMLFNMLWNINTCELMPYGQTMASTINWICNESRLSFTCQNFLNNINYLRNQSMAIDSTFKLIPYSPAGISTKVVIHYMQIARAKRFQQFDYGRKLNRDMYGSDAPPEYDLKKVTLPVYFVYSDKDKIATPKDVAWLMDQLPKSPERKIESVKNFRHVDFSLNTELEQLLTRPLTDLLTELAVGHREALSPVHALYKIRDNHGVEGFLH